MITTYKDYKKCLEYDFSKNVELQGRNMFFEFLKGNIRAYEKYRFLKNLRFMELCENNIKGRWGGGRNACLYLSKTSFSKASNKNSDFHSSQCLWSRLEYRTCGFSMGR